MNTLCPLLGISVIVVAANAAAGPALAATEAVSRATVNVRSGPSTGFPSVGTIPNDQPVTIHRCNEGYLWCDTSYRGQRGWVSAKYLALTREGRRVRVDRTGQATGIEITPFAFEEYWAQHYRQRAIYRDRHRWRPAGIDPGGAKSERIWFAPAIAAPGSAIRLRITDFPPRTRVEIGFGPEGKEMTVYARGRTDDRGRLEMDLMVPRRARPGQRMELGVRTHENEVYDRAGIVKIDGRPAAKKLSGKEP